MAKFFKQFKDQMREREAGQALLATPREDRPVLVYAEDDYSWNQLGPYVRDVTSAHAVPVSYVTSDANDPLLANPPPGVTVTNISASIAAFLPKVDSPVFATTMPDLDSFHIKRPVASTVTYLFHSLNSIHMAYRPGAFDAYDAFFCTGPHHREELDTHFRSIGRTGHRLFDVGYPKLDGIVEQYRGYTKRHPSETTVLIAPSWGDDNLLAVMGPDLISALESTGLRVVIRPHPAFFESIYPEGAGIVTGLQRTFADNDRVTVETSIASENSFLEADLMVCDWSGAAYEYALGTKRPVLSIDLPPKVKNPGWESLGIVPFEDRMRFEIGEVVAPGDAVAAAEAVTGLLSRADDYRERLTALREAAVFNVGTSAAVGGQILADLAKEGLEPGPTGS